MERRDVVEDNWATYRGCSCGSCLSHAYELMWVDSVCVRYLQCFSGDCFGHVPGMLWWRLLWSCTRDALVEFALVIYLGCFGGDCFGHVPAMLYLSMVQLTGIMHRGFVLEISLIMYME